MLKISHETVIPEDEMIWENGEGADFFRVKLIFDLDGTFCISKALKKYIRDLLDESGRKNTMYKLGKLELESVRFKTAEENRSEVFESFTSLLKNADLRMRSGRQNHIHENNAQTSTRSLHKYRFRDKGIGPNSGTKKTR